MSINTELLQKSLDDMRKDFMIFYGKEDCLKKLDEVCAERASGFHSLKNELYQMLVAHNFPNKAKEKLLRADAKTFDAEYFRAIIKERVPTRRELIIKLFKDIYKTYSLFAKDEQFIMARIVKRLTDDAFPNDSLRMKILKQFLLNTDYYKASIRIREPDISKLTENIFDRPVISVAQWNSFFRDWVQRCSVQNLLPLPPHVLAANTGDQLNANAASYFRPYRAPTKRNPKRTWGDVLKQAYKDFKKNLADMTLPKLADELAASRFNFYGGTKKNLYLFAFAFGMEFDSPNPHCDLVKNLFWDFYNDNFLRQESFPTGEGVNFKNYVEVIYIWWLNQKNLTSAQRLSEAENFIEEIFETTRRLAKSRDAKERAKVLKAPAWSSKQYRDNFLNNKVLNMDKTAFENYLVANYYIYSTDPRENNNRLMMASDMDTVKKILREIVDNKIKIVPNLIDDYREDLINALKVLNCKLESAFNHNDKNFWVILRKFSDRIALVVEEADEIIFNFINNIVPHCAAKDFQRSLIMFRAFLDNLKRSLENVDDSGKLRRLTYATEYATEGEKAKNSLRVNPIEKLFAELQGNSDGELAKILADEKFITLLKKIYNILDVDRILNDEKFFDQKRFTRTELIALHYFYFKNFADASIAPEPKEIADKFLEDYIDDNGNAQRGLNSYLAECGFSTFNPKILYDGVVLFFLFLENVW